MSFRMSRRSECPIDPKIVINGDDEGSLNEDYEKSWPKWALHLLTSSPYDIYLMAHESIESIDWNSKAKTFAWPFGNLLTFLLFTLRLVQDNVIKPNYHKIGRSMDGFDMSKSSKLREYEYFAKYQRAPAYGSSGADVNMLGKLESVLKVVMVFLVLWNVFIAYKFLFGYFQTYSMFYLKQRPNSNTVTKKSLNDLAYRYVEDVSRSSLWSMLKFTIFQRGKKDRKEEDVDYYFEIQKWCPSLFLTALFVSFSPLTVVFLLFSDVTFAFSIPLLLHQYLLWFIIFERYENRVLDEQAIFSGTMAEINAKMIKPKASIQVQDAIVDATLHGHDFVQFYPAYTAKRSHLFTTHTLSGELVRERYNAEKGSFEDAPPTGPSKNLIRHSRIERLYPNNAHKRINGASVRPLFPSKNMNQNQYCTPPKFHNNTHLMSSNSVPNTPLLRMEGYQNPDNNSMLGTVQRESGFGDSRINGMYELRRRNSSSPLKRDVLNSTRISHEHFSNYNRTAELERLRYDDLARRMRSPNVTGVSNRSSVGNNTSHISSRNSSISPFKLSRHGSVDNRPPFR